MSLFGDKEEDALVELVARETSEGEVQEHPIQHRHGQPLERFWQHQQREPHQYVGCNSCYSRFPRVHHSVIIIGQLVNLSKYEEV